MVEIHPCQAVINGVLCGHGGQLMNYFGDPETCAYISGELGLPYCVQVSLCEIHRRPKDV